MIDSRRLCCAVGAAVPSRKTGLIATIQIVVNFGSRNQHAPKSWEFPKHFAANESANRFLANTQLCGAAIHVEGLAFDCQGCVGHEATRYDFSQLLWCGGYTEHRVADAGKISVCWAVSLTRELQRGAWVGANEGWFVSLSSSARVHRVSRCQPCWVLGSWQGRVQPHLGDRPIPGKAPHVRSVRRLWFSTPSPACWHP